MCAPGPSFAPDRPCAAVLAEIGRRGVVGAGGGLSRKVEGKAHRLGPIGDGEGRHLPAKAVADPAGDDLLPPLGLPVGAAELGRQADVLGLHRPQHIPPGDGLLSPHRDGGVVLVVAAAALGQGGGAGAVAADAEVVVGRPAPRKVEGAAVGPGAPARIADDVFHSHITPTECWAPPEGGRPFYRILQRGPGGVSPPPRTERKEESLP